MSAHMPETPVRESIQALQPRAPERGSRETGAPRGRRAVERTARSADLVVDQLAQAGADVVFGLPGGAISPVFDALLDRPDLKLVTTKHEAGAVFAAIGHARATGRLGVVVVTSGPGILNTLTGLASARLDGVPVLVLAGEVARASQGKGGLQEGSAYALNVVGIAQQVCKFACEAPTASVAPSLVRRAIEVAQSGRQGPVVVTLPLDVLSQPVRVPEVSGRRQVEHFVAPEAVEHAARALTESRRKVLLAGSGARFGDGPARLRAVAERLACPVITTPKAKGVFPESHPLSLGVFGIGGHPSASRFLEGGVEVMLAVGTSFSDLSTNGWSPLLRPSRTLIHVDVDGARLGLNYEPQLGVVAPAERFLEALLERLPAARGPASFGVERYHDAEARAVGARGEITPQRAMWELQRVLPSDTVYTIDSGEHTIFGIHYLVADAPDTFQAMTGLGAMGSSVPAALGVASASPGRTVAALCGDGGFAMCAPEIATAAQRGLPILVAVFDDRRLGMVKVGHELVYGRSPDFAIDTMDVARAAEAFGADSLVILRPGEILEHAERIRNRARPLVLDIRIDETETMPRNARTQKLVDDMGWPGQVPPAKGS